jgi:hypothetical protein
MGCAYTGSAGGPMRTEMPTATCENDAAEKDKMMTASNHDRTAAFFPFIFIFIFIFSAIPPGF